MPNVTIADLTDEERADIREQLYEYDRKRLREIVSKPVTYSPPEKCKCENPLGYAVNYEPMWHEWDEVCSRCKLLIKHCDAG